MPVVFHRPRDRRAFLEVAGLGGAAVLVSAFGHGAPVAPPGELHLALLSDTHVPADRVNGHRGMSPWENLRVAAAQVAAARPEGVVICGDVARLEGRVEDYQELKALLAPVAAVSPVYVALGNHDDRTSFRKAFADTPGVHAPVDGKHVTVIEHEAVRVVVLDSLLYVNEVAGLLGKAQRAWLASYLPTSRTGRRSSSSITRRRDEDGDLLDGDRLLALAAANRHVKAIFHGHAHVWALGRRDRLHVVGLPALGYNFSDAQPVGWVGRAVPPGRRLAHAAGPRRQPRGRRPDVVPGVAEVSLSAIDILVFVAFYGLVLGVSLWKSRGRQDERGLLPRRPAAALVADRRLDRRRQHLDRAVRGDGGTGGGRRRPRGERVAAHRRGRDRGRGLHLPARASCARASTRCRSTSSTATARRRGR